MSGPRLPLLDDPDRLQAVVDLWRETGRRTEIQVQGGSMFPLLRAGQLLEVDHREQRHAFGSLVVFLQGRMLVAHRVVGHLSDGSYLTKGDALLHFDRERVRPRSVVGQVTGVRGPARIVALDTPFHVWAGAGIGAFSLVVGGLNRALAPLRSWTGPAGRLAGRFPGPTRILRRLNSALLRTAARLARLPSRPYRVPAAGERPGKGAADE